MPKVKHRHSKTRGRKRRTHYKLEGPALTKCPQCSKLKKAHHVCPYCGYYKGTEVVRIETLEERREKQQKKHKKK